MWIDFVDDILRSDKIKQLIENNLEFKKKILAINPKIILKLKKQYHTFQTLIMCLLPVAISAT